MWGNMTPIKNLSCFKKASTRKSDNVSSIFIRQRCRMEVQAPNPKRLLPEIGSYALGLILTIICYFLGSILVVFVWGFDAPYSSFAGLIVATLQTVSSIVIYVVIASAIAALKPRHIAIPPMLLSTVGLTITALSVVINWPLAFSTPSSTFELLSGLISFCGWGGYGFFVISSEAQRRAREYGLDE